MNNKTTLYPLIEMQYSSQSVDGVKAGDIEARLSYKDLEYYVINFGADNLLDKIEKLKELINEINNNIEK